MAPSERWEIGWMVYLAVVVALHWMSVCEGLSQADALLGIKYGFGASASGPLASWVPGTDPCSSSWAGVGCTATSVTSLSVGGLSLSGTLNSTIGALLDLNYLSLIHNNVSGSLPDTLTSLTKLTWLEITSNHFDGPIPEGISACSSMKHLHLSYNKLSSLYSSITTLTDVVHLLLDNNAFDQTLPPNILSMPNLEILQLSNNNFSAQPDFFANQSSARLLQIVVHGALNNSASAQPLPLLSAFPNLAVIDFGGNQFYGPIPPSYGALTSLETIDLSYNAISNTIPATFLNLTSLNRFSARMNHLAGSIPDLSGLSLLETLDLQNNNISSLPLSLLSSATLLPSFEVFVSGNPVCSNSTLVNCQPNNTISIWSNDTLSSFCSSSNCTSLQAGLLQDGFFYPSPVVFEASQSCTCVSPLRATLLLQVPSFTSFSDALAAEAQSKTVMAMMDKGIQITLNQVVVNSAKQKDPGLRPQLLTLDFYPPASSSSPFNVTAIKGFLQTSPEYLGEPFNLQKVWAFTGPSNGTSSSSGGGSGLSSGAIAGIVVGCVVAVILITAAVAYIVYIRTKRHGYDNWSPEEKQAYEEFNEPGKMSLKELKEITNDFDPQYKIGEGGYGEVYKGVLGSSGQEVAVKRAKREMQQGGAEFQNEILLLNRCRHRNLVELLGYCAAPGEQLLVYEFVRNGTLSDLLYGKSDGVKLGSGQVASRATLAWEQRIHIALGSARGLAYLHHAIKPPIIHRDIKPANILVDEHFNAKMADFGLSKSVPEEQSEGIQTKIKGTAGYLDPEYYLTDLLTEKSDVYSFGVVLLELATGWHVFPQNQHIRHAVAMKVNEQSVAAGDRAVLTVMDPSLRQHGVGARVDPDMFEAFLRLGMRCSVKRASSRPSMQEVEAVLSDLEASFGRGNSSSAKEWSDKWKSMEGSTGESAFDVRDEEEGGLPPKRRPFADSSGDFSQDGGAFVGPDGDLYESGGGVELSEVIAK